MSYTFDERIVSDLHKDARGFRPSQLWWEQWVLATDDRKQQIWDGLCKELSAEIEREKAAHAKAMISMHQRVQGLMISGAKDEVQALRWIMQAEGFDEYDLRYGPSYFCYHFDLPYSAEKEFQIREAMEEMLLEAA